MNAVHLLRLRLLLALYFGLRFCASVAPPPPPNGCASQCGTLSNVSFPFGAGTSTGTGSCGLPEFLLNCSKSHSSPLWWPELLRYPLYQILNITANHIIYGTFVVRPVASPLVNACSAHQKQRLPPAPTAVPIGLQFSPYGNIVLVTNCSESLTGDFDVNEFVDGFSFSSPNCLDFYSVCHNAHFDNSTVTVPCLEAVSADANVSHVKQKFNCLNNVSLFEMPRKSNSALSIQLSWTISQSYYDCKACQRSNGNCSENNVTDSFWCSCPEGQISSATDICGTAQTTSCNGVCRSRVQISLGTTAIAVAILIVAAGFGVYYWRQSQLAKTARRLRGRQLLSQCSGKDQLKQMLADEVGPFPGCARTFSYDELAEATDGFAERKMLGDGGFGMVYEGTLASSGEKVAVKRLYSENTRRLEQFLNEIRILSALSHPNLVRLFGFCCESYEELLLVYEFASNGTLADNVHGMASKGLLWETRLSIALETARALAYLHTREPPILHRDVKSSNILLDDNFHAKLADFGLSRLGAFPMTATHVSTAPQGTPGYVDPQYQQCYQLTDKSDVYSFGVVLMELISGKEAVDMSRDQMEINLSSLAVAKIQTGALDELIDPCLEVSRYSAIKEMVTLVAELAFQCLARVKDDRPSMDQVARALQEITDCGYGSPGSSCKSIAGEPGRVRSDSDVTTRKLTHHLPNFKSSPTMPTPFPGATVAAPPRLTNSKT